MRPHALFFGIPFMLFAGTAEAQLPILDIGIVPMESGQLEVRMRPDADFDGLFSSLTFTVRWDATSSATLGDFIPTPALAPCMYPSLSLLVVDGGYNYAIQAGFGFSPLSAHSLSWTAGQEFVLGHFDVINGPATFQIVAVDPTNHNGSYFVSLNSVDQTGVVYEITTSTGGYVSDPTAITIFPNPSTGATRLSVATQHEEQLIVEVLDVGGRMVQQHTIGAGSSALALDANTMPEGSYLVRVNGQGFRRTIPWIVQHP